ncbi:MAG: M48 family metallopeptidase [Prevotella sp.]|nr:M48 family metallopeptidase [Prevotella sp.]MDY4217930.1 M48 family metallopeptidase [Prevotella sp.]
MMKNKMKFLLAATALSAVISCGTSTTVPVSGRSQRISVSDGELLTLSKQEYAKFMASAKRSTDLRKSQMVERVGRRLATAVENYLRNNGYAAEVNNFNWEFNLVQDKQANAFCMPGGKIVVYEGLLPITQDEAGLAIVLGHEIAHAVAKHSAEQLTKRQNQQIGTSIVGSILNSTLGSGVGDLASQVASGALEIRNLKYSRDHEYEADYMGLIFAAMAGYNPQTAISFWQRMASSSNKGSSDFLSSHPADNKRIAYLQTKMNEALKYYQPATKKTTTKTFQNPSSSTTTNKKTGKRR